MSIFSMLRVTRQIQKGHDGRIAPPRTMAAPPAPPPAVNLSSGHLPEWMATRPLPVEAQILLRVMGEDIPGAVSIIRLLAPRDRSILRFYLEQTQRTINDVDYSEGRD